MVNQYTKFEVSTTTTITTILWLKNQLIPFFTSQNFTATHKYTKLVKKKCKLEPYATTSHVQVKHGYNLAANKNLLLAKQQNFRTVLTENQLNYYYHNHFTALWTLSGTTRVSQYQKKHSTTHT